MKKNWIRNLIGGLSLTSALFVFQACYGTQQDFGNDILVDGVVISKSSELPIKGIKVSVSDSIQYEVTDENGRFSFYTQRTDSLKLFFEDIDSTQNGSFLSKDTIITDIMYQMFLDIKLEEN